MPLELKLPRPFCPDTATRNAWVWEQRIREGRTLSSIAKDINRGRERVRQIEARGFRLAKRQFEKTLGREPTWAEIMTGPNPYSDKKVAKAKSPPPPSATFHWGKHRDKVIARDDWIFKEWKKGRNPREIAPDVDRTPASVNVIINYCLDELYRDLVSELGRKPSLSELARKVNANHPQWKEAKAAMYSNPVAGASISMPYNFTSRWAQRMERRLAHLVAY